MRKSYDYEELSRRYGFNAREMEKVCRIADLLEDVSAIRFLSERLSLYGGTAFAFVYSDEILRLSVDLDFNYRQMDDGDWGEVRIEVDERIKDVLYRQGYGERDISISPSYPLARFTVQYMNAIGARDDFRLETGYMRRYPILRSDTLASFRHIGTGETFAVKTPTREELFANKWCTLMYRKTPRDLFDVYQITRMSFNQETFRLCAVVDSLTRGRPKLTEINVEELLGRMTIDSGLRNLLQANSYRDFDFKEMTRGVVKFSEEMISCLTGEEIIAINRFYENKVFEPELFDDKRELHPNIKNYPAILWALKSPPLVS